MEDYATKVTFTIFYIIRNGINELEKWGDELLDKGYPEHSEEFWTLPRLEKLQRQQEQVIKAFKDAMEADDSVKVLYYGK